MMNGSIYRERRGSMSISQPLFDTHAHLISGDGDRYPPQAFSSDLPPPHYGIDETIAIFEDVPNVPFKITEINTERLVKAGVPAADIVRRIVDSFGPDRLIWGSDVGQSMLWSYDEKAAMARDAASLLSRGETVKFLHDNAARIFATKSATLTAAHVTS